MADEQAQTGGEQPPKPSRGNALTLVMGGAAPPPTRRRKFALTSLRAVRREMGVVYWEARNGQIAMSDAARLTFVLSSIGKTIFDAELELRLQRVEDAINTRRAP